MLIKVILYAIPVFGIRVNVFLYIMEHAFTKSPVMY